MPGIRFGTMVLVGGAALALGSCDLIKNLPLITPQPLILPRSGQPITFVATISQNGEPIAQALGVRCQVTLRITPQRTTTPIEVNGIRLASTVWNCPVPQGLQGAVRPNQVIGVTWQVFSPRNGQDPLKVAESPFIETMVDCSNPTAALRAEQTTVLAQFGNVTTVAQLAQRGFIPSHGFASFAGMGVAFVRAQDGPSAVSLVNAGPPTLGQPNLLLFLPSGNSVTDVSGPDQPYTLIGWAYAKPIRTDRAIPFPPDGSHPQVGVPDERRPVLTCIPHHEWMIHASGQHTLDGGFHVQQLGGPGAAGLPHTAIWDLHVFADRTSGTPRLSILNDTPTLVPAAGLSAPTGSFFYPTAYDQSVSE